MVVRKRTLDFLSVFTGFSVLVSAGELHKPSALFQNPSSLKQRIFKPASDVSDGFDMDPSTLGRLLVRQNTCPAEPDYAAGPVNVVRLEEIAVQLGVVIPETSAIVLVVVQMVKRAARRTRAVHLGIIAAQMEDAALELIPVSS
ncbi:hypothetical protein BD410DRAFT_129741 [Rickenella mellea]|uniref:Uncharacterized protein n=1 Tax=Rickenella mellea TaxID=50990 RepID=A0A4Y7Q914_9AGAM|nr:hypothetical protein BD410DRAFT_129741 [Rickenella mellea]